MYEVTDIDEQDLTNRFTHHPPKANQLERYEAIREHGRAMAHKLMKACPRSRELSLALTHLEEAVMFANAAIARHE